MDARSPIAGWSICVTCPSLLTLKLAVTSVTEVGLEQLGSLRQLQELNLWYDQITDAGLKHPKPLVHLRTLG